MIFIKKYLVASLLIFGAFRLTADDDGWVSVPREEKIVHQLEEEDLSIWVVFAKTFGSERVLVRFPTDPAYQYTESGFEAWSSHYGQGELTLLVQQKQLPGEGSLEKPYETIYHDPDTGRWIFEKHVETAACKYVLRLSHPSQSHALFRQFSDSFEVR